MPDYVTILSEVVQQARIIPLDGRPHLPQGVRQWLGDSRGRWEGNTLIVETTNLHDKRVIAGLPAGNVRLVERFTRVGANAIDYQFTVNDPTTWTAPWTRRRFRREDRGRDVRIRVSRGQSLADDHAQRRSRPGETGRQGAGREVSRIADRLPPLSAVLKRPNFLGSGPDSLALISLLVHTPSS